jgi:hypothetical protein
MLALNVLYISPPGVSLQYFDGHLFRPLSKIELHTSFNVFDTSGKVAAQNFLAPPMNPGISSCILIHVCLHSSFFAKVVSAGAQLQNLSAGGNFNLDIEAISKFNVSSLSYIVCSLAIINRSLPLDTSSQRLKRSYSRGEALQQASAEGRDLGGNICMSLAWG